MSSPDAPPNPQQESPQLPRRRPAASERWHVLTGELAEHLPYTMVSSVIGIALVWLLTFLTELSNRVALLPQASEGLFHIFHPMHLTFSAIATTAMSWRYEQRIGKTIAVGAIGTLGLCGLSDSIIPFIGGDLIGQHMQFHVCLIEHPQIILPFVALGILGGFNADRIVQRSTLFSHAVHVFVSTMASILYLVSFGLTDWAAHIGGIFVIIVIAVLLPCCLSDIIFPVLVAHAGEHRHG